MEHILATLEGPVMYYGFTAQYLPPTAPPLGTVQVGVYEHTRTGEDICHMWVAVSPDRQAHSHTTSAMPVLEGITYHLISGINQRPTTVPGLHARFVQPDA